MSMVLKQLQALASPSKDDLGTWLFGAEDGVAFLKDHVRGDTTILYASMNAVLIHGVLVPDTALQNADRAALSQAFIFLDDSWVIEHVSGGGEPDRVYLDHPLRRMGPEFADGEKLIFLRSLEGRRGSTSVEISQKLVHALSLHFMPERNAWCRLNDDGDIEDVITVKRHEFEDWSRSMTLVTILSNDLANYTRLAGTSLFYFFDFTRFIPSSFNGWNDVKRISTAEPDLFYSGGVGSRGSYINGRMIVRPAITYADIVSEHMERRNPTCRQYATFKAVDLRTSNRIEVSADPDCLSNYFEKNSTRPLEMSPAFFRARSCSATSQIRISIL